MIQSVKNIVLRATTQLFPCDVEDTIVVTGSPRSGTTWLSELLRELPGYKMLNEPLHLKSAPETKQLDNLDWRTHVSPNADFPELESLLRRALTGRVGTTWKWRLKDSNPIRQLMQHTRQRKLLVKLIRAGRMLPWVTQRFPVRAVVSTFRHPCAVVASQLNFGWEVHHLPESGRLQQTLGQFPDAIENRYGGILAEIDTPAGLLAAVWCIDTYLTLRQPVYRPWIVTTYEDLLERREAEMNRIFDALDAPVPEGLRAQFDEPSHSAADDLSVGETEKQLTKWRDRLDNGQIDTVLRIVEKFGLDLYTNAPRPNHDRLRRILDRHDKNAVASAHTPSLRDA